MTVSAVTPPPPKAAVFRSSGTDVQSFAFSSTNAWVPGDAQPATFPSGNFVVGLALSGSGPLLRTSASDMQVFTINRDLPLTRGSATPTPLSGTGASVATSGAKCHSSLQQWIQTFTLTGTPPPNRVVLLQYESLEKAKAWFDSQASKDARKIGEKYSTIRSFIVEGVAAP